VKYGVLAKAINPQELISPAALKVGS
jgi:hypothetical protein